MLKMVDGIDNAPAFLSDIPAERLEKMNHAEWLADFSKVLALNTRVPMSPGRQGMCTRLLWASQYVRLLERRVGAYREALEKTNKDLEAALAALDVHLHDEHEPPA
jgi:hypothetical protein